MYLFFPPPPLQLYDWMVVNRVAVMDVLKEQDEERSGVIPSDKFTEVLQGIGVPLQSEEFDKLLKVYDKKGEGKLNYEDFLTEQKFIHAVSLFCMHNGTCRLHRMNTVIQWLHVLNYH